ncbi:MAG: response regulator [Candidatus Omnitrophica bacterium]|nr:response regulator [Candidatus Omnitrophota bacterium]
MNKILVLADAKETLDSIKSALEDSFDLILTDSPLQAENILLKCKNISLSIIDIKSERRGELDFADNIKNLQPGIKIIASLDPKRTISEEDLDKSGICGYFTKPHNKSAIRDLIFRHFPSN